MPSLRSSFVLVCTFTFFANNSAEECGRPEIQPQLAVSDRIVGGQEAVPGSWPWVASVNLNVPYLKHSCSGVLISDRHVLSAAHCFTTWRADELRVHFGSHTINVKDPGEQSIVAEEICNHRGYKSGDENDIALIKLKNKVNITRTVSPVCLPQAMEELPDNHDLYAVGWGHTSLAGGRKSVHFKQALTKSMANERCIDYFGKPANPEILCSGLSSGHSARGDSGGPVLGKKGDTWYAYGIVFDGPKMDDFEDVPMLNTKVSHYVDSFIYPYLKAASKAEKRRICDLA